MHSCCGIPSGDTSPYDVQGTHLTGVSSYRFDWTVEGLQYAEGTNLLTNRHVGTETKGEQRRGLQVGFENHYRVGTDLDLNTMGTEV